MNTLETRVLEMVGEDVDSPDVFTDDSTGMAQIRDSINDAIEEICMLTGSVERKWYIPLKANKNFYKITSIRNVFAWPTSVWLVNQKRRLELKDFIWMVDENPRWLYNEGTPVRYFLIGSDKIAIHPAPSSATDMVEVNAVAIPSRYTLDTDKIKLRNSFQWATVHRAVSDYWASRGDAKSATRHFMKYLERLGIKSLYPEAHEQIREFSTVKDGLERPENQG
jgi:hypothetical protein